MCIWQGGSAALGPRGPGSVFPGGGAARLTGPDVLGRLVPPQRSRSLGAQRPGAAATATTAGARHSERRAPSHGFGPCG